MSRNRNNSMNPMPDIRDNFYRNGPTPAYYNKEQANNCLFNNTNYNSVTSNNSVNFDNSINSIQQMNFKQDQFTKPNLLDKNVNQEVKENYEKEITLVIDSIDRDIDSFKNSFDFKVRFNPTSSERQPLLTKS